MEKPVCFCSERSVKTLWEGAGRRCPVFLFACPGTRVQLPSVDGNAKFFARESLASHGSKRGGRKAVYAMSSATIQFMPFNPHG